MDNRYQRTEQVLRIIAYWGLTATGLLGICTAFMWIATVSHQQPELYVPIGLCLLAAAFAFGLLAVAVGRRQ